MIDNSPAARAARLRALGRDTQAATIETPKRNRRDKRAEARRLFWKGYSDDVIAAALDLTPAQVRPLLAARVR